MKKNPWVAFGTHTTTITDSDNASTLPMTLEYNSSSAKLFIESVVELDPDIPDTDFTSLLAYLYSTASNIPDIPPDTYFVSPNSSHPLILGQANTTSLCPPCYVNIPFPAVFSNNVASPPPKRKGVQTKKKYKPVAMKTKPVTGHVSEDFQIKRQIIGDPLATMPPLAPNPPPFLATT